MHTAVVVVEVVTVVVELVVTVVVEVVVIHVLHSTGQFSLAAAPNRACWHTEESASSHEDGSGSPLQVAVVVVAAEGNTGVWERKVE